MACRRCAKAAAWPMSPSSSAADCHKDESAMKLEYVFSYNASVVDMQHVGGPFGKRRVARCGAGTVSGPRLNGEVLEGAHDWVLDGPDGWGRIDVRAHLRSHDGCVIYAQYLGILEDRKSTRLNSSHVRISYAV